MRPRRSRPSRARTRPSAPAPPDSKPSPTSRSRLVSRRLHSSKTPRKVHAVPVRGRRDTRPLTPHPASYFLHPSVDATPLLSPAFLLGRPGGSAPLQLSGYGEAGTVDLTPFQQRLDERVWLGAESARCAVAERPNDCQGVEHYLRTLPSGAHADEARALLEAARERLAERARMAVEQRRLEAEQRRLEVERWEADEELRRRAERAAREREQEARQAEQAERRRQLEEQSRQRAARAACERTCRESCAGNYECQSRCVGQQCR